MDLDPEICEAAAHWYIQRYFPCRWNGYSMEIPRIETLQAEIVRLGKLVHTLGGNPEAKPGPVRVQYR